MLMLMLMLNANADADADANASAKNAKRLAKRGDEGEPGETKPVWE